MIFVVAAHNRGHLRDVANGVIHVLEANRLQLEMAQRIDMRSKSHVQQMIQV